MKLFEYLNCQFNLTMSRSNNYPNDKRPAKKFSPPTDKDAQIKIISKATQNVENTFCNMFDCPIYQTFRYLIHENSNPEIRLSDKEITARWIEESEEHMEVSHVKLLAQFYKFELGRRIKKEKNMNHNLDALEEKVRKLIAEKEKLKDVLDEKDAEIETLKTQIREGKMGAPIEPAASAGSVTPVQEVLDQNFNYYHPQFVTVSLHSQTVIDAAKVFWSSPNLNVQPNNFLSNQCCHVFKHERKTISKCVEPARFGRMFCLIHDTMDDEIDFTVRSPQPTTTMPTPQSASTSPAPENKNSSEKNDE